MLFLFCSVCVFFQTAVTESLPDDSHFGIVAPSQNNGTVEKTTQWSDVQGSSRVNGV